MKKGCLSGIECGRGTNKNKNLHKDLNRIMSSSKYGVELAYALLTVVFLATMSGWQLFVKTGMLNILLSITAAASVSTYLQLLMKHLDLNSLTKNILQVNLQLIYLVLQVIS